MRKQRRRFVSALLAMSILFSVMVPFTSFGAAKISTQDQNQTRLLSALGVNIDTQKAFVTRADFAAYIFEAVRLGGIEFNGEMPYQDVKPEDSYYNAVGVLYQLGVLSESERFNPDNIITSAEIAKIMVSALGYDLVAQAMGGFPYGYIRCALSMDISLGDTSELSGADMPKIICEMLAAHPNHPIIENQTNISDNGNGFLLYHNVRPINGVITENTLSSIYEDNKTVAQGYINIDGVPFAASPELNDGVRRIGDCLGSSIEAYVYDYNGDNEKIIYFDTTDTVYAQFNTGDVDKNDFVLEVDENGKQMKYYLSTGYSVIWNGKLRDDFTDADFETVDGTILLVDNNNDRKYDVVHIEKPEYMICDDVNALAQSVSDKNKHHYGESGGLKLHLNDASCIYEYFINEGGVLKECTLNDLESYHSFAVIMSRDEQYVRLIGFSNEVSGDLTEHSADGNGTVIIGGVTYGKTEYAIDHNKFVPVGSYVVAYLTPDNKLIYFESSEDNMRYGFLMKIAPYDSFGNYAAALLFEDGRKEYVYFNKTLTLDGNKVTVDFNDGTSAASRKLYPQLIRYSLDASGKLACIDTALPAPVDMREYYSSEPNANPKNSLLHHTDITSVEKNTVSYTTVLAPSLVPRTMKIFRAPTKVQTEAGAREYEFDVDDFDVVSIGEIKSGDLSVAVYDVGENRDAGAMVYYAAADNAGLGAIDRYSPAILVDRITDAINDDGVVVKKISFISFSGTELTPAFETAFFSEDLQDAYDEKGYDIRPGDLARIARSGNIITNIQPEIDYRNWIYADDSGKLLLKPSEFGSDYFCAKGKLIAFTDSVISVLVDDDKLTDAVDNSGIMAIPVMGVSKLVRYDSRTKSFEQVTISDLNTVINSGFDNADRVLVRCLTNNVKVIAFYPATDE